MDSDNILSILASLGNSPQAGAPPTNVMQTLAPAPVNTDQGSIAPPPSINPAAIANAAIQASPATPRKRVSLVDVIGHLADGLAQAGGATPMYQKTMDAMQANQIAGQNQASKVDLDKLDIATKQLALKTGQTTADDSERTRFASVLDAVNDPQDAANLPQLMAAAGLTDQRYAPFVKMVQDNPEIAKVLSGALGGGKEDKVKYGGNIVYGKDANGNLHAYQANITGGDARDVLPAGITPVDPLEFVNTGGAQVGVGKLSGSPKTILPNSAGPDTVLTTTEKANEFQSAQNEKTQERDDKATAANLQKFSVFDTATSALSGLGDTLDDLIHDPNLPESTGLVGGKLNLSDAQRTIEAKIDNVVNQAIAPAIATIKQSGGAAPRSVAEIMGAAQALLGAVKNRTAPYAAYIANIQAAHIRLNQRIQLAQNAAIREGYAIRGPNGFEPAPAVKSTPAPPQQTHVRTGAPTIGTVQQGYRFKGGNPADKNSWEKVN